MNWTTLYITGRTDFREDVRKKLESSKVDFMPGYIDGSVGGCMYDLYWLAESVSLRKFKEAIGSKLIWKYRLQFHTDLEEFIQTNKSARITDFTTEEKNLMESMRKAG